MPNRIKQMWAEYIKLPHPHQERFGQYVLNRIPELCGQGDHMIFYEMNDMKAFGDLLILAMSLEKERGRAS